MIPRFFFCSMGFFLSWDRIKIIILFIPLDERENIHTVLMQLLFMVENCDDTRLPSA